MELYYCGNCQREHCLNPKIESKGKRGISRTASKTPIETESERREDKDIFAKTLSYSSRYRHSNPNSPNPTYNLDDWKSNKISKTILLTPNKPNTNTTNPSLSPFFDKLFIDQKCLPQTLCTPIKESSLMSQKLSFTTVSEEVGKGCEKGLGIKEKSFGVISEKKGDDVFRRFQNQYAFGEEIRRERDREKGRDIIRLSGRSRSYKKKIIL